MDKSWMETNRISKSYVDGVAAFTDYAVHNLQKTGNIDPRVNKKHIYIPCPCTKCLNHIEHKVEEVQYHLYRHGIDISYTKWTKHGEEDEPSISAPKPVNATTEFVDDMDFAYIPIDGPTTVEMVNATKDNFDVDDLVKFQELLLDAEKPFYEGCPDFTKLSAIVKLLNLKGKYGASDKFFTELLGLIKKMLPADSQAWHTIDEKFPEIAEDTRNLRLGISADGVDVNTGNRHHSVWPVLTVIYNLPPWLCMKRKFINLSVLISGYPGNDIDVFLEPLVDDLHTLFETGVDTRFKGCVVCGKDTNCVRLSASSKQSYIGHRRYLPYNHPFRKQKKAFNGQQEFLQAPIPMTGEQIYNEIQKQKRNTTEEEGSSSQVNGQNGVYWKKFNIWYRKLKYWRHNPVPHCIDFMHVEKNVAESIVGTLLHVPGKTKDGLNARLDLAELGVKPELFAMQDEDKTTLPPAGYTLTNAEKDIFCETLHNIKVIKGHVRNRNKPEGCIAEETIAEETIEFFSEYHKSMETIGIPPDKHETYENEEGKPLSAGKSSEVSAELFQKAHLYVIQNTDEIVPYIERHKQVLKTENPGKRIAFLENEHSKSFAKWLREEVERELAIDKESVSETVRWISYGPRATVVKYDAYNINGYTFRTKCHDGKVYQNSGVSVEAIDLHISKEVATTRQAYYYGVLQEIWVLDYRFRQIPLFKCDWVNHKSGGVKRDKLGYTLVDLNNLGHKVDPFVLASQALQVFYVKDPVDKKLSIVFKTPPKNYKDTYDEVDEEFSTVIHHRNDNVLPLVDRRDLANESRDDYYRKDCGGVVIRKSNTSEEIDYDSPKPPKSLLKWYYYLSDEYKDNGRFWGSKSGCNESDVKSSWKDIKKAKAQASEASSKAKVEARGSKAKLQASTKTLIFKSHGSGSLEVDSDVNLLYDVMFFGEWAPNGKKLIIISIYAPQELREKKMLWDYLIMVLKSWNGDVIIMGDFNEVRTQDERHGLARKL
ncbi:transposable element [Tanacetum coccineum]